jgi:hypothetical protein
MGVQRTDMEGDSSRSKPNPVIASYRNADDTFASRINACTTFSILIVYYRVAAELIEQQLA